MTSPDPTRDEMTTTDVTATRTIRTVLVANRGEIARRIFRTCRDTGRTTVAVYSEPDADAPFVQEADLAVPLGGVSPAQSYLRGDLVIEAALRVGADAIHPGYGFLSENAEFARAVTQAGLVFIGPDPRAIELMGSKLTAHELMSAAGVPVLPGRDLTGVDRADLAAVADEVGWPVLVKASAGGGGRGMRVVRERAELVEAVESARREAGAAFGDETVFLEHYVDRPRHVEIQIFGDRHGTVTHLGERECSIQRRHQKIVEESPSPAVDPALRARMGAAAVEAGRTLGYVGAGTVEFILDPAGDFFFLEVNTRLQVEHPVTELVTGLDLVQLQLDVAAGLPLPPAALAPEMTGHAIEVRLYAEDPAHGFLPAAGVLDRFEVPAAAGVRVDSGVESGVTVSTSYDPMLAKVIAHGRTRDEARARLVRALRGARVDGVTTNLALLTGILEHPEFVAGALDTHFLARNTPAEIVGSAPLGLRDSAVVAAALAEQSLARAAARVLSGIPSGFRNNPSAPRVRRFVHAGAEHTVEYRLGRDQWVSLDGRSLDVTVLRADPDLVDLVVAGVRRRFTVGRRGATIHLHTPTGRVDLAVAPRFPDPDTHLDHGSLTAPMPGTVVRVLVGPGDGVVAGERLIILEAMKMEHAVVAPADAVVRQVPVVAGQTVDFGATLVVLEDGEGAQSATEEEAPA